MKFLHMAAVIVSVIVLTSVTNSQTIGNNLVPLYRLYRIYDSYHFYATEKDANYAEANNGFIRKSSPGSVATSSEHCQLGKNLEPVYRLYKPGTNDDHFFTLCESEVANAVNNLGYRNEGIKFYCAATAGECGASLPFYKFRTVTKHFYTININEGNENIVANGGIYEGVLCYIWPVQ